ncbi:MAG: cytochrome C oxidase subunit IV family protein [Pseudomonadales bacterium]|nr:cytochrome C oxidase subunit IV family protein [Pseudomonadales bacterium]
MAALQAVKVNRWVYIVLVMLTLLAASLQEISWIATLLNKDSMAAALILIAGIKILFVTEYFMELHEAPLWLRGGMHSWLAILLAVLISAILNHGLG